MGIAFVFIIYAVGVSVLAVLGGMIFGSLTAWLLRKSPRRRRWILIAAFFPAACAVWAGLVFVAQAAVNLTLLHCDVGLGDGFDIPLPDHYAISYTDVTDYGLVYNPRTQLDTWSPQAQTDAVANVRLLQMAGKFLVGAADTHLMQHFSVPGAPVDSFFVLDTELNKRTDFATQNQLSEWAAAHGLRLSLEPIANFYSRYRLTWFDGLALALLLLPPAIAFSLLARPVMKARRDSALPSTSAAAL